MSDTRSAIAAVEGRAAGWRLAKDQILKIEAERDEALATLSSLRDAVKKVMCWTQPGTNGERWEYDAVRALLRPDSSVGGAASMPDLLNPKQGDVWANNKTSIKISHIHESGRIVVIWDDGSSKDVSHDEFADVIKRWCFRPVSSVLADAYKQGRLDERKDVTNWLDRNDEEYRVRQEHDEIHWGGTDTTNEEEGVSYQIKSGAHLPAEPPKEEVLETGFTEKEG